MARTAAPDYPKGHSTAQSFLSSGEREDIYWKGLILLGDGVGIGQGVVSSCVVQHLFFLGFNPLFLVFVIIISSSSIIIFSFVSIIKLFLS